MSRRAKRARFYAALRRTRALIQAGEAFWTVDLRDRLGKRVTRRRYVNLTSPTTSSLHCAWATDP